MEQFSLSKWLEDKSLKVVTRDGRPVRIACTDSPILHHPIVGFVECDLFTWTDDGKVIYGGKCEDKNDLFFADEEKDEFETTMISFSHAMFDHLLDKTKEVDIKEWKEKLLDLARKEIEKENSEFKPKFTYNEKDYSKLANKLIEFRNNTPLCSVSYRDGEGRKIILHYEKEILDLVRNEIEKENPYNGKKKQEWSEDDEEKLRDVIRLVEQGAPVRPIRDHYTDWLKSLKDRFQLQPKQEWSEDDERIYNEIIDFFLGDIETRCTTIDKQRHFGYWLKSLRSRHITYELDAPLGYDNYMNPIYPPINHWKPSEEQMQAIKYFIGFHRPQANASTEGWSEFKHLENLYNKLKKL